MNDHLTRSVVKAKASNFTICHCDEQSNQHVLSLSGTKWRVHLLNEYDCKSDTVKLNAILQKTMPKAL